LYEYKAEITTGLDSVDTDSENKELVLEATNSLLPEQDDSTTEVGKLFQMLTILLQNEFFLMLSLERFLYILYR
jgi:hypothetical protein